MENLETSSSTNISDAFTLLKCYRNYQFWKIHAFRRALICYPTWPADLASWVGMATKTRERKAGAKTVWIQ